MGFNFGSSVQVTPTAGEYFNSCNNPGLGVFVLGGNIYSLVYSVASKQIGFWVSSDKGLTWSQLSQAGPFPAANSPGSKYTPLYYCFDGSDTVYIVVDSPSTTHMQVWSYTISTDTWAQFGPDLVVGPGLIESGQIFIYPNGNVIVFYVSGSNHGSAPFPPLYYSILSGGVWGSPVNLGSLLVPAPTGNTSIHGPFVDGAMIGGSLGNIQNYANPSGSPNYVFGVSISNAGVASDVANSLVTAVQADAPAFADSGFVTFGGKIYGMFSVDDSAASSFPTYLVSFDGTTWAIVSTQAFTVNNAIGPLTTDGTNLYYTFVDAASVIHLMSSADGGLTWASQLVSGDPTFISTSIAVFVPGYGMGFWAEDISGNRAFLFIPLASSAPALRGTSGGSTTQPRCCDRPWSPVPSEKLTEPDLAVPIQGQRVCFPAFLASPTDALVHVIGQYQVPQGYWFQLDYLVLNYLGSGWTPGDGNVTFSLDVNTTANPNAQGVPVPFYNPVNVPLGSFQKPWPVRPGVLSRLEPRDILRAKVKTNPLSIPPGLPNQFVSVFVGHLWPVN